MSLILSGNANAYGELSVLSPLYGGTGETSLDGALRAMLPEQLNQDGKFLSSYGGRNVKWASAVTSINIDGGGIGITVTGGPITTEGTLTLGGVLNVANGGTGETNLVDALNAMLPVQADQNGKFLSTDGTGVSWTSPVTKVDINDGGIGLTVAGGPITTEGTFTLGGVLNITHGGTGTTSATGTGKLVLGNSPVLTGTPTVPTAPMESSDLTIANTSYVTTKVTEAVQAILGDTPAEVLDTLVEIGNALNNDPDFAATITASIATKVDRSGDTMTGTLTVPVLNAPTLNSTTLTVTTGEISVANINEANIDVLNVTSLNGNASTATALATPVNITIGNKVNAFNGSSAIAYSLKEILPVANTGDSLKYDGDTWVASVDSGDADTDVVIDPVEHVLRVNSITIVSGVVGSVNMPSTGFTLGSVIEITSTDRMIGNGLVLNTGENMTVQFNTNDYVGESFVFDNQGNVYVKLICIYVDSGGNASKWTMIVG